MGHDRTEARERGAMRPKMSTKHPIAAIEKRVMDSAAYADLTFSARAALLRLAHNLGKGLNGHILVTREQWEKDGFNAKTKTRAIADLINHGMIYRTRRGGIGRGCSTYALTWISITKKEGLFLQAFKPCAWRDWNPEQKKLRGTFLPDYHPKNVLLPPSNAPKMSTMPGDIFTPI